MIEPDEDLIRPTAARYARRYRMVERDDIAQELRLWWLSHQTAVKRYVEGEEIRKLAKALNRAADRHCRAVKAQVEGYRPEDEHFYNSGLVRELIPMVWKPGLVIQDNQPDPGCGPTKRTAPANEGNGLLAMVSDVSRALDRIHGEYHALLVMHYYSEMPYEEIAETLGITVGAAKMRVQRAVDAVVEELGGESPYDGVGGPGSRRAISNAHAVAITHNQEAGE